MATGAAFNYPMMLLIRFLFGMGEAGAWPCVARTFSRWIPVRERGRVQGVFFAGAHLVGGLTPVMVLWLLTLPAPGARSSSASGRSGLVWVAIWHTWFRNDPSEHPSVNAAELQTIVPGGRPTAVMPAAMRNTGDASIAQPKHDRDVRHVHPQLHDLLFLHHLAADLSEAAAWLRRRRASASSRAFR